MTGSPAARLAARAVVAVLVPLLGAAWLAGEKQVTLLVDGQAQEVRTHAGTVVELLDRAGIDVANEDRVVPHRSSPVVDGMVVEYVAARRISVLIDGIEERVVVTALTIDEVLDQIGTRVSRNSVVRPSRLALVHAGMVVEVRQPVAITLVADGEERDVITNAETVGVLLARLDLSLGAMDRISPDPDTVVKPGMRVHVQRVTVVEERREEEVPAGTVEQADPRLPHGERRQVRAGEPGVRAVVERVVLVDGVEESRTAVSEDVLREPRPAVVAVGSGAPSPRAQTAPAVAAPAPAQESEQAAPSNTQTGRASRYSSRFEGRRTASGEPYDSTQLTAAHRTLPLGTVVTVTNLSSGRSVRVRINDRGPYVDGRIIDLSRAAFEQIANPSKGVIDVRIEW